MSNTNHINPHNDSIGGCLAPAVGVWRSHRLSDASFFDFNRSYSGLPVVRSTISREVPEEILISCIVREYLELHWTRKIMSSDQNDNYVWTNSVKTDTNTIDQGSVWARFQVRWSRPGSLKSAPGLEARPRKTWNSARGKPLRSTGCRIFRVGLANVYVQVSRDLEFLILGNL